MGKYHIPHSMLLGTDKQSKEHASEKPVMLLGSLCPETLLYANAMPSKIAPESLKTL